jgi:hypothetical protein
MATINPTAASNFFYHITEQYDVLFPQLPLTDLMTTHSEGNEAADPLLQKKQEYNQALNMTQWYQKINALTPLNRNDVLDPELRTQRDLESTALHYSALDHLKVLNEESYILPSIAEFYPPAQSVISISNPKSELDSLIFRKVYCGTSDQQRERIIGLMQEACKNLDPKFFNTDHLIYRVQGAVAFLFSNLMIRQIVCGAVILAPIALVFYARQRIYTAFINAMAQQWETVVKQNPDVQLVSRLNIGYRKLKEFNNFTTKTNFISWVNSQAWSSVTRYSAKISTYFPPVLTAASWIVYPKTGFNWCALRFTKSYMVKPALVAFKVFNGTEYRTIEALKERFKTDSIHCEKAVQAHALWMHLQKKGTPEECLTLMGFFAAPSA